MTAVVLPNSPLKNVVGGVRGFTTDATTYRLDLAISHQTTSPYIAVYSWNNGFGLKAMNPSSAPNGAASTVSFSPAGDAIVLGNSLNTPYLHGYPWSAGGFGTRYTNPVTMPGSSILASKFSPAGEYVTLTSSGTPYILTYPWSSTGFGTKIADPSPAISASNAYSVSYSPSGSHIAFSTGTTPYMGVLPWTGAYGTRINAASALPGQGASISFSPAGDYIVVSHITTSPYVSAYPWTGSAFGTKLADPASALAGPPNTNGGTQVTFSSYGEHVAIGHTLTPFISVYPWSGGFGTKVTAPTTPPASTTNGIAFSPPSNEVIAVAHATTPFISTYAWSPSGFGTRYTDPATVPGGTGYTAAFNFTKT